MVIAYSIYQCNTLLYTIIFSISLLYSNGEDLQLCTFCLDWPPQNGGVSGNSMQDAVRDQRLSFSDVSSLILLLCRLVLN